MNGIREIMNHIVEEILNAREKFIVVRGNHDYGKSSMLKKAFDLTQGPKIFQSGSNPAYRRVVTTAFLKRLAFFNDLTGSSLIAFIDEIDDQQSIHDLVQHCNLMGKVVLCTNHDVKIANDNLRFIDLAVRYSYATDIVIEDESIGSYFRRVGNDTTTYEDSLTAKKGVQHSICILVCEGFSEVSTIHFD